MGPVAANRVAAWRRWGMLVVLCYCGTALSAEEPGKPTTPEERKALQEKVAQLDKRMDDAYRAGRLDEAVRWAQEALHVRELLYPADTHPDGHTDLAGSINDLGFLLQARGDYSKAQPPLERALAMREKLFPPQRFPDGHADLATSLNNLGFLLKARGDYTKAQALYERALAMNEKLFPPARFPNGHLDLALSMNNLGTLLQARGEYAKAQPLLERALAIVEKQYPPDRFPNGHRDLARSINNLGGLLQARGEYTKAQSLDERALAMFEKLYPPGRFPNGHPDVATSINNLGSLLKARGHYAEAQPLYERALVMTEKFYPPERFPNGHPDLATSINNLASVLHANGAYGKAQPYYDRALAMYEKFYLPERIPQGHIDLAISINNLGGVLLDQGEHAKAQPLYERAVRMYDGLAAGLVRSGTEADALNFAASLPLARDSYLSLPTHLLDAAARTYTLVWQSKATLTRVLARRQWVLRAPRLPKQARHDAERIADLRRQREALLLAATPRDVAERDRRLADLQSDIDNIDRELLRLVPGLQRAESLAKRSPADLQKALPGKTVLIDLLRYVHFEQDPAKPGRAGVRGTPRYVGFVVSQDWVRRVELGEAKPIEETIETWREAITEGKGKALSPTARGEREAAAAKQGRRLREMVWDKLAEHLPRDVQTVYLSPDGDLTQVPWAALPGRKPDTILLEDHALAVVPHGPFLLDMLTPDPDRHTVEQVLLAVGDVRYDDRPASTDVASRGPGDALAAGKLWPNLPGSAREIEQVRALADKKGWKVQPLTAADAGPAALLKALPGARVAHLATHGYFADKKFRSDFLQLDEKLFEKRLSLERGTVERIGEGARSPLLLSGVVLAGANRPETPGRGIVTAEALVGLDLSGLDLAVLSACETGLGEVAGGEGVFGLQRAFHLAGTRNVVASLWQVDDDATAALMVLFYRFLWEDKLPPIEALWQAQLEVYRHPEKVPDYAKDLRAPRPAKFVDVTRPDKPEPTPSPDGIKHAPVHRWAAFVLSGPGR